MPLSKYFKLFIFTMFLAGCATSGGERASPVTPDMLKLGKSIQASEYRIGVDDEIEVIVWRNDDLSVTVPVRPDGKISVPLVGDVAAGGRTPSEVARDIERGLGRYIREPQVTVSVTDLRSHEYLARIRVTGAVETPSSMPHRPGMTVLDAVLESGGVTEFASGSKAKLYRRKADGTTAIYAIRLDQILDKGDLSTNVQLMPGDIVAVPERIF